MADVFISYASADRKFAALLAQALARQGYSVWWDRKIVPGRKFDEVIESELERAKSVITVWSKTSVASEWVKTEAAIGAERDVLIPVRIDGCKLPIEFRRRQTADLTGWDGTASTSAFSDLLIAIQHHAAPSHSNAVQPEVARTDSELGARVSVQWRNVFRWGPYFVAPILVIASGYLFFSWPSKIPKRSGKPGVDYAEAIVNVNGAPGVKVSATATSKDFGSQGETTVRIYVDGVLRDQHTTATEHTNLMLTLKDAGLHEVVAVCSNIMANGDTCELETAPAGQ